MNEGIRVRIPKPGTLLEYWRAVVNEPAIPEHIVSRVLIESGIGSPVRVRNLPNGWRNSVVLVEAGGSRFVMRRYPDRWADAGVRHEHSLLLELAARQFPAPRLVALGDGSYLREIDGGRYSLQTFEEGHSLTGFYLSTTQIIRLQSLIGGVLAHFHETLAGFVPQGSHHLGIDPDTGRMRRDLAWHLAVIDDIESGSDLAATFGDASQLSALRDRLVELQTSIDSSGLPLSIVHGDFGLHNIIFRGSGESVVHDFELSRLDIRLLDLIGSLSRLRPEFRLPFLTGLEQAGGLDPLESTMLETVWEWHRIRGALQSAEAYRRLGGDHRVGTIEKRLAEARRIRSGGQMVPR